MKALIVGCGIAGTATAMALQKVGIEATLFEAFEQEADGVGAFLTLASNGVAALQTLGVDAHGLGGFDTPRMVLALSDDATLASFVLGGTSTDAVAQTIKRSDLYVGLRDETVRRGIRIEMGKRLVDAEERSDGGVIARFADGSSAEGDLLIGADGLRSQLRRLIDPQAPAERYVPLLNVGGYARGVATGVPAGTMRMVFGKRCFFGFVPRPDGEVWWFANLAQVQELDRDALARITPERWRNRVLSLVEGDRSPAAALVRATEGALSGWPTYDLPRVARWHRSRMLIVGDAAHAISPSSGQGASMAIEDAIVLARCLRDVPGIEAAFSAYERERRERVEAVVAQGRRNGSGKTPGLLGRVVRDWKLRLFFRWLAQEGGDPMAWITRYRVSLAPTPSPLMTPSAERAPSSGR